MSHFTDAEIAYLKSQRLGRLATVNANSDPHLTVVGFQYNPELDTIDIGGRRGVFPASKKLRDVKATGKVAFIVDNVNTEHGWEPHSLEIRGRAEIHQTGGEALFPDNPGYFDPVFIRIHPMRIVSLGINGDAGPSSRNVG
jgi:pyridoxamine 5'-phosphate oxidase family protein